MPDPTKRAPAPFSLRLTQEERQQLDKQAGDVPLSVYIRSRLFDASAASKRDRQPASDHKTLAQILGQLGQSGLASNIADLAHAARSGSVPLDPETQKALRAALADIREIKSQLMGALGIRED
ncbi:MAG: hypothetical protein WD448_05895 [Woeseia sp.]